MNGRYHYKGKNLTSLILMKTEKVAELLVEQQGLSFEEALNKFMKSVTYRNLQDTETLLWGESAGFILDDYQHEICG
jgi:hypothetical protein